MTLIFDLQSRQKDPAQRLQQRLSDFLASSPGKDRDFLAKLFVRSWAQSKGVDLRFGAWCSELQPVKPPQPKITITMRPLSLEQEFRLIEWMRRDRS